jgi:hypothetical protein
MNVRPIRKDEKDLIAYLLTRMPSKKSDHRIPEDVFDLADGGMGSIQFNSDDKFGQDLVQVKYKDTDGQIVLITLVEGQSGQLFELDIWKVDFSPLNSFPKPDQLEMLSGN